MFAASFLWIVWGLSALPFVVLVLEFGSSQLGACGHEVWYYASFYSHMFLYPLTFGLLSTWFLHRPWIQCVDHVGSLSGRKKTMTVAILVISVLLATVAASIAEFTGASPAIWSISPEVLSSSEEGRSARQLIEKRCNGVSVLKDTDKQELYENLTGLMNQSDNISWTERSYYIGFVAMVLLFAMLFVTIIVAKASGEKGKRMVFRLMPALILATFWMWMRITFLTEKFSVFKYDHDPLLPYNFIIFAALLVLYIHLLTMIWTRLDPYEKFVSHTISLMGLIGLGVVKVWVPKILVLVFGTGSSPLTYVFLLLLILVITSVPTIIRTESMGVDL